MHTVHQQQSKESGSRECVCVCASRRSAESWKEAAGNDNEDAHEDGGGGRTMAARRCRLNDDDGGRKEDYDDDGEVGKVEDNKDNGKDEGCATTTTSNARRMVDQ